MIVGYADPPYPGRSKRLYGEHPDYQGEVDHAALIDVLVADFDAFALHTSSSSLRELLPLCPDSTRVLAWIKPWASWKPHRSPAFAWEPVLIAGHRRRDDVDKVRDFYECHPTIGIDFRGAKPRPVIEWVFAALGLEIDDELHDLFPGTGAVARAWHDYRAQRRLRFDGAYEQTVIECE